MAEFFRHLGLFENWAATYISMNFVSGMSDRELSYRLRFKESPMTHFEISRPASSVQFCHVYWRSQGSLCKLDHDRRVCILKTPLRIETSRPLYLFHLPSDNSD